MINTTDNVHDPDTDLQEAITHHDGAFAVIRPITDALNLIPTLCTKSATSADARPGARRSRRPRSQPPRQRSARTRTASQTPSTTSATSSKHKATSTATPSERARRSGYDSRRPSRRQLRRRARQARRDGYQPMVMINSDDFPEPALAVIARWIWRYRSELAPFTVAIATALAALILHHTHPNAWPWPVFASAVIIALCAAPLPRWVRKTWGVLQRPAERAYVAMVTATLGGWLAAAIAIGPQASPMPALGAGVHHHVRHPLVDQPQAPLEGPR